MSTYLARAVAAPVLPSAPTPTLAVPTRAHFLARTPAPLLLTVAELQRASTLPVLPLPNPNRSPGCSPLLRAVLELTGLPYTVYREMAYDGDQHSHAGGNALDVVATPDLHRLCRRLTTMPALFAAAVCYSSARPEESLFIWNGQLSTLTFFGGVGGPAVSTYTDVLHLSSSTGRLSSALRLPAVVAALDTRPLFGGQG